MSGVPREKETYRDTLERVREKADKLYPDQIIYKTEQVAAILGVSRRTAYNWGFKGWNTCEQIARRIC